MGGASAGVASPRIYGEAVECGVDTPVYSPNPNKALGHMTRPPVNPASTYILSPGCMLVPSL